MPDFPALVDQGTKDAVERMRGGIFLLYSLRKQPLLKEQLKQQILENQKLRELVEKKSNEFKQQRDEYEKLGKIQDCNECHLLWWWLDWCLEESKK